MAKNGNLFGRPEEVDHLFFTEPKQVAAYQPLSAAEKRQTAKKTFDCTARPCPKGNGRALNAFFVWLTYIISS